MPAVSRQVEESIMFLLDEIIHPMVVDQRHEPFNDKYLQRIEGVLCNALQDHPQTTVIRVDLHLPEAGDVGDSIVSDADLSPGLMSRFIDSLKAQIVAYRQRKARKVNAAIALQFATSGYWSNQNWVARNIITWPSSSTQTRSMLWEAMTNRGKVWPLLFRTHG